MDAKDPNANCNIKVYFGTWWGSGESPLVLRKLEKRGEFSMPQC